MRHLHTEQTMQLSICIGWLVLCARQDVTNILQKPKQLHTNHGWLSNPHSMLSGRSVLIHPSPQATVYRQGISPMPPVRREPTHTITHTMLWNALASHNPPRADSRYVQDMQDGHSKGVGVHLVVLLLAPALLRSSEATGA